MVLGVKTMREIMAQLGFRTVAEMVGRTDRLESRKAVEHWKARGLDFSKILYQPEVGPEVGRYCQIPQDHGLENALDNQVLLPSDAEYKSACCTVTENHSFYF